MSITPGKNRVFPSMGLQAWSASHLLGAHLWPPALVGLPQDPLHLTVGNLSFSTSVTEIPTVFSGVGSLLMSLLQMMKRKMPPTDSISLPAFLVSAHKSHYSPHPQHQDK